MSILLATILALLIVLVAARILLAASPTTLAAMVRSIGPIVLALVGLALLFGGHAGAGVACLAVGVAWQALVGGKNGGDRTPGQRSMVRTAALEMQLDHDSGRLEGLVLAGRHEGKKLGTMRRDALLGLYREIVEDPESRQLIEAYLDSRFPVWRENLDANAHGRLRSPPRPGAMTKQEAYQVLGLEAGASAAEIRKAHRRLVQRVHADVGGSSFLTARINEAKDVLLSDHR